MDAPCAFLRCVLSYCVRERSVRRRAQYHLPRSATCSRSCMYFAARLMTTPWISSLAASARCSSSDTKYLLSDVPGWSTSAHAGQHAHPHARSSHRCIGGAGCCTKPAWCERATAPGRCGGWNAPSATSQAAAATAGMTASCSQRCCARRHSAHSRSSPPTVRRSPRTRQAASAPQNTRAS